MHEHAHARWDAGEVGCGRLATELAARIRAIAPGERLEVIAPDSGAETDIPAWCRMTGNPLVAAEPPRFLIERKGR